MNIPHSIKTAKGVGHQHGLSITLRNNYDDYFFTTMSTTGYLIQIFYSQDFPDKLGGSLTETIVNLGMESLISFHVEVMRPTDDLMSSPLSLVSFRVHLTS